MRGVHGGKAQARQRALSPTLINITIAYSGPRHPVVKSMAMEGRARGGRLGQPRAHVRAQRRVGKARRGLRCAVGARLSHCGRRARYAS